MWSSFPLDLGVIPIRSIFRLTETKWPNWRMTPSDFQIVWDWHSEKPSPNHRFDHVRMRAISRKSYFFFKYSRIALVTSQWEARKHFSIQFPRFEPSFPTIFHMKKGPGSHGTWDTSLAPRFMSWLSSRMRCRNFKAVAASPWNLMTTLWWLYQWPCWWIINQPSSIMFQLFNSRVCYWTWKLTFHSYVRLLAVSGSFLKWDMDHHDHHLSPVGHPDCAIRTSATANGLNGLTSSQWKWPYFLVSIPRFQTHLL